MFFSWLEDAVRHHGAAHAVVQRDTYLSFRGLLHRAGRRMQELKALGVGPGHAVGVMLGNVSDYLVIAAAVDQLEAALVPIAPLCSARELGEVLRRLPLRALVTRPGAKALDPQARKGVGEAAGPTPTKRTRMQGSLLSCALYKVHGQSLPAGTTLVHPCPALDDEGALRYQLIHRTRQELGAEAEHLAAALRLAERDREYIAAALPLHQPFNLELILALTFGYGAQLQLDDDLAPRRLLPRLRDHELSLVPCSRAMLRSLLLLPSARKPERPPRLLAVDGAVGRDLSRDVSKVLGTRPLSSLHLPATGLIAVDAEGRSPHTVGGPIDGVETRILGARGAAVGAGRRGQLQVRSPAVSLSGRESEVEEGWLDTGERATRDKQGRLKLHGRTDDGVLVGGLPVSLGEIRLALTSHAAVVDAAVEIGADGPSVLDGAAAVRARVQLRRKVSTEALSAHCARLLSPYKVPTQIEVVDSLD